MGVAQDIPADYYQDVIEDIAENLEIDGAFDYNTILEQLDGLAQRRLDINNEDLDPFITLGILSPAHQTSLRLYIQRHGPLISIYELQAVPGFDLETIRRIRPFVTVSQGESDRQQSLVRMLSTGKNELFVRWSRTLQDQRGFLPGSDGTIPFQGDPARVYTRFRHTSENRLSYGITAEKDPGEEFFKGNNNNGFDFYSYHFFLNGYRRWMPRLALGDYVVNIGQGLIMHSGFGVGKGSFVTQIKKGGYTIRPFTSVSEYDYLRGAAATIQPGRAWEISVFASSRNRDGNIRLDSLKQDGEELISRSFSSLQSSGLHRTLSEIEDKNSIAHRVLGASAKISGSHFELGLNAAHHRFDEPLLRSEALYNYHRFAGDVLTNASVEYTLFRQNVHFFGEVAWSGNGAIATINGLLLTLHRNVDLAVLARFLPPDYHTVSASTFGESSQGNNEHGVYIGAELRPMSRWTVTGYIDVWRHPWLRFGVDAPASGEEMYIRVAYRKKRTHELYLQFKNENKERNLRDNATRTDQLVFHRRRQVRLHFSNKVSPSVELRSRVELSFYKEGQRVEEHGFLLYQDLLFRPLEFPLSFTTRFALFDTDDFDTRIYAYENDLINQFYIPAYNYRGSRFYLNLKYKGIRDLTLEFRFAQTRYFNRDVISSGNNQIEGNLRTDLKAQVKYIF